MITKAAEPLKAGDNDATEKQGQAGARHCQGLKCCPTVPGFCGDVVLGSLGLSALDRNFHLMIAVMRPEG